MKMLAIELENYMFFRLRNVPYEVVHCREKMSFLIISPDMGYWTIDNNTSGKLLVGPHELYRVTFEVDSLAFQPAGSPRIMKTYCVHYQNLSEVYIHWRKPEELPVDYIDPLGGGSNVISDRSEVVKVFQKKMEEVEKPKKEKEYVVDPIGGGGYFV